MSAQASPNTPPTTTTPEPAPPKLRSLRCASRLVIAVSVLTLLLSLLLIAHTEPLLRFHCRYAAATPPLSFIHDPAPDTNPASAEALSHAVTRHGLLFIVPRPDGLSNQRITIAQGLRCAQYHRRVVVLPPIFANTRYGARVRGPFPFADFFDLAALHSLNISFATPEALRTDCVIHTSAGHIRNRVIPALARNVSKASQESMPTHTCVTQALCDSFN